MPVVESVIAKSFSEAGASVVVAARRTEEIDRVAAEINESGGSAIAVTTDVTDDDAVKNLAKAAAGAEYGKVTPWVNNAGGSPMRMPLSELPREEWDRTVALNLTSIYIGCVRGGRNGEGSIINITRPGRVLVLFLKRTLWSVKSWNEFFDMDFIGWSWLRIFESTLLLLELSLLKS